MGAHRTRFGVLTRDQQDRLASVYYGYALHCVALHLQRRLRTDADAVTLVAHDALMTALRTYDERVPFRPWLATTCRYAVLTHVGPCALARRKARLELFVRLTRRVEAAYCGRHDPQLDRLDQAERVASVLARLTPKERAVVEAVADGARHDDVAARFGRHKSFTSQVLARCRGMVAKGKG